jgi:hypothetical protein
MKNKRFFAGMLASALVFELIVMGCDNGTNMPTKFEGTWKNSAGSQYTYTFTGYNYSVSNNSGPQGSGTFTFTEISLTFIPSSGAAWTQDYTLSDTTLTLVQVQGHPYGSFTKQ